MIDVGETEETVTASLRRYEYTFTVLLDRTGEVSGRYEVLSLPAAFLIDKEGRTVFQAIGYREWDSEEMRAIFTAVNNE